MAVHLHDTLQLGTDRVIGVWEREGCLIDPGPESTLANVLESMDGREPKAILLTHIHLDHAGATGELVRRYPDLPVYVHEVGAPHLIDPEKLLKSATRLYGDQMDRLWGRVLPVPAENVHALSGGETVAGMQVIYTPGHASHHVNYLDPDSGDAFVGDVGGVRIPPSGSVRMPTPPPDIDLEAWARSLDALSEFGPERLLLTHFGAVEETAPHIDAAREQLRVLGERSRDGDRDAFMGWLLKRIEAEEGDAPERLADAMPPDQVWLGLERYWRKREG